jgi:HrpA-like RNA helicase
MAETLGEPVGQTVGYRVRGDSRVSKSTGIEVVTEGILTRMIQSDPGLDSIGAVIFDEFHEHSLNADLGLALCLEIAGALRDDLILLAMSATLDAEPVAALMNAPIVTSEGRNFPVENAANALPQALVLTAIVIGFGLFAFALTLTLKAYTQLGTLDTSEMRVAEPREE